MDKIIEDGAGSKLQQILDNHGDGAMPIDYLDFFLFLQSSRSCAAPTYFDTGVF